MDSEVVWKVEFVDFPKFRKSLKRLSTKEFLGLLSTLTTDLSELGLSLFKSDKAKWLGNGLAEYRYRLDPNVLVRCFFVIQDEQIFLILSSYDKKRDSSAKRQQREIALAREIAKGI